MLLSVQMLAAHASVSIKDRTHHLFKYLPDLETKPTSKHDDFLVLLLIFLLLALFPDLFLCNAHFATVVFPTTG